MRLALSLGLPPAAIRGGGGAAPWSPAALFASGEAGAWYDPSDGSTVFQDAAMMTAAGEGDPVGAILDKSGNGNHATQTTSARRPARRRTAGGLWYLEFDGVDDSLVLPSVPYDDDVGFEVWAGVDDTDTGTSRILLRRASSNVTPYLTDSSGRPAIYWSAFRAAPASHAAGNHVIGWIAETISGILRRASVEVDGATTSATFTLASKADEAFVGITENNSQIAACDLFGMVIYTEGLLTSGERSDLRSHLATKAGVTL